MKFSPKLHITQILCSANKNYNLQRSGAICNIEWFDLIGEKIEIHEMEKMLQSDNKINGVFIVRTSKLRV